MYLCCKETGYFLPHKYIDFDLKNFEEGLLLSPLKRKIYKCFIFL